MKTKLLILVTILVNSLYSQCEINRMFLHDTTLGENFTRRFSGQALTFKSPLCCDADTIYVSILSDSIDTDRINLRLFTYFPKNINPINSIMLLNYDDGTNEILYQIDSPNENNYVEYYIVSKQWYSLSYKKVKSITFRGIETFKLNSKDKSFFINFYKKIF